MTDGGGGIGDNKNPVSRRNRVGGLIKGRSRPGQTHFGFAVALIPQPPFDSAQGGAAPKPGEPEVPLPILGERFRVRATNLGRAQSP